MGGVGRGGQMSRSILLVASVIRFVVDPILILVIGGDHIDNFTNLSGVLESISVLARIMRLAISRCTKALTVVSPSLQLARDAAPKRDRSLTVRYIKRSSTNTSVEYCNIIKTARPASDRPYLEPHGHVSTQMLPDKRTDHCLRNARSLDWAMLEPTLLTWLYSQDGPHCITRNHRRNL